MNRWAINGTPRASIISYLSEKATVVYAEMGLSEDQVYSKIAGLYHRGHDITNCRILGYLLVHNFIFHKNLWKSHAQGGSDQPSHAAILRFRIICLMCAISGLYWMHLGRLLLLQLCCQLAVATECDQDL